MFKQKKIKAEEKIRIAKDCIAGRISQNEAEETIAAVFCVYWLAPASVGFAGCPAPGTNADISVRFTMILWNRVGFQSLTSPLPP